MSIYIAGENLPSKYPVCLVIWPDGRTEKYAVANVDSEKTGECKAEQVPSHGNLIDADKFLEWVREFHQESAGWLASGIINAPIIVRADCQNRNASDCSCSMNGKDTPVDAIQNDAYLLSCQCPVCMRSIPEDTMKALLIAKRAARNCIFRLSPKKKSATPCLSMRWIPTRIERIAREIERRWRNDGHTENGERAGTDGRAGRK